MKRSREPEEDEEDSSSDGASPPATAELRAYKIAELDESVIDDPASSIAMRCSLPPHREVLAFKTYGDYEVHYSKAHMNRCAECARNLPSEHLLSVHIEECHDAFAALRREKGEHTVSFMIKNYEPRISRQEEGGYATNFYRLPSTRASSRGATGNAGHPRRGVCILLTSTCTRRTTSSR